LSKIFTYKISIIIVNYNVEYFLDQCLDSVVKAIKNVSAEVIIVDNNSVDGSLNMLSKKYPQFKLIANKFNGGFSKANNQAIKEANGEYILLLNPDTVVEEETFSKTIAFMDSHPNSGGLGVHMIDGRGRFLPESKRGLPTPMVAFYKIFGFSSLFPKSKRFGQYHLGHLSQFETNIVDVLSGAFMMMRKETLDKVGLLDEDFFMYGEDIDLSYRITLGGYDNYYFSETTIIHYKGESTKKSSVNYVFVFYRAMIIFAKKHFGGNNAKLYSLLINLAIYLRASFAIIVRVVKQLFLPFIDLIYLITGLYALTNYWKISNIDFPKELIAYSIPIYAITWLSTTIFNGGYDSPYKFFKLIKGVFWGTIFILVAYAILPKSLQFSRLFIFIGALWVIGYYLVSRVFLHFAIGKRFNVKNRSKKRFVVVGKPTDDERIFELIYETNEQVENITLATLDEINEDEPNFDELVFCSETTSYNEIINTMSKLKDAHIDFKIAPKDANHIIGSNSIDTAGDLYISNINRLTNLENQRKKRLFDICISSLILLLSPILIFLFSNRMLFLKNISSIFIGKLSFIGFSEQAVQQDIRLPKIKPSVLFPTDINKKSSHAIEEKLNLIYARDYSMRKDLTILIQAWRKLDQ
jgi:O-antigen biosynthesis protein